jgi:hypothetical protein
MWSLTISKGGLESVFLFGTKGGGGVFAARSFTNEINTKPIVVEAMGALYATEFCTNVGLRHLFGGRCLTTGQCSEVLKAKWNRFGQIVKDIQRVSNLLSSWQIGHVKLKVTL